MIRRECTRSIAPQHADISLWYVLVSLRVPCYLVCETEWPTPHVVALLMKTGQATRTLGQCQDDRVTCVKVYRPATAVEGYRRNKTRNIRERGSPRQRQTHPSLYAWARIILTYQMYRWDGCGRHSQTTQTVSCSKVGKTSLRFRSPLAAPRTTVCLSPFVT